MIFSKINIFKTKTKSFPKHWNHLSSQLGLEKIFDKKKGWDFWPNISDQSLYFFSFFSFIEEPNRICLCLSALLCAGCKWRLHLLPLLLILFFFFYCVQLHLVRAPSHKFWHFFRYSALLRISFVDPSNWWSLSLWYFLEIL